MTVINYLTEQEESLVIEPLLTLVSQNPFIFSKGKNEYKFDVQRKEAFENFVERVSVSSGVMIREGKFI